MDDPKAFFFEFNSNKSCSGSYIQYFHKFSSNFIREKRFQFVCQLNFSVGGASQVNDIIIILFQKSRILNIVSIIRQVFWRNSYGILPTWKNRWLWNSFRIHSAFIQNLFRIHSEFIRKTFVIVFYSSDEIPIGEVEEVQNKWAHQSAFSIF